MKIYLLLNKTNLVQGQFHWGILIHERTGALILIYRIEAYQSAQEALNCSYTLTGSLSYRANQNNCLGLFSKSHSVSRH